MSKLVAVRALTPRDPVWNQKCVLRALCSGPSRFIVTIRTARGVRVQAGCTSCVRYQQSRLEAPVPVLGGQP